MIGSSLTIISLAGAIGVVAASPASAADRGDSLHIRISGLCLDAENDASGNPYQNGDKVQLWTCNGQANQGWHKETLPGGWFMLTNDASGKCLDAENDANGSPSLSGDKVQLWDCNGAPQQTWQFAGALGGNFGYGNGFSPDSLVSGWFCHISACGWGLVLDGRNDAAGKPWQNGDKVQLWAPLGTSNQEWY